MAFTNHSEIGFCGVERAVNGYAEVGYVGRTGMLSQDIFSMPPWELPRTVSELMIIVGRLLLSCTSEETGLGL